IEHFGQKKAVVGPGLHFKWPWPIDSAYRVAVDRIHEMKIGIEEEQDKKEEKKDELILWTNEHSQEPHLMVLLATPELARHIETHDSGSATRPAEAARLDEAVADSTATRPADQGDTSRAVPVSMLRVAATIQYKVRDAWSWLTAYENPEEMLQAIANRE